MEKKAHVWMLALVVCILIGGQAMATSLAPQRSSEIVGATVQNPNGDKLGKIDELIIGQDGAVTYAILSHGGLLGIGDKLVPVPWKAFRPAKEDKTLIVNMDKAILEKAPNFDPKQWPDMASSEWQKKFEYYKTTP